MNCYQSNLTLDAAARLLNQCRRAVVVTHAKPDGDAFGSVVAITLALRQRGVQVEARFVPPVPANLASLGGASVTSLFEPQRDPQLLARFDPDLVVVLDTGAWVQIGPLRSVLEPWTDRMLILDHHLSGDIPARHRYIEGTAAACCEVVAHVLDEMQAATKPGDPPEQSTRRPDYFSNRDVAAALFVGIAPDTGWFRFSNTRPQTHELAARLIRAGVDHAALYQSLEQTDRPEKLALLTRAMNSLRLEAGGRIAVMVLRASDFLQSGALLEETERIVDIPQTVAQVQMVILITQTPPSDEGADARPGPIRVSFRSKPSVHPGAGAVNVAELAQQFGGGGHARAAGAKLNASLEEAVERVTQAAILAMAAPSATAV